MGDQPGAFAILFPKESIYAAMATSATPHSEEFGDLRAVGTFEELGGHSNEGSTLSRPDGCILGRVTSLALKCGLKLD